MRYLLIICAVVQLMITAYAGTSTDRFLASTEIFQTESNGNKSRIHDFYAGVLLGGQPKEKNQGACTAYCAKEGFSYAALLTQSAVEFDCFCGNTQGAACSAGPCLDVYDASALVLTSPTLGSEIKLFDTISLDAGTGLTNFDTIGVHYDGRIKEYDFSNSGLVKSINIPNLEQVNVSLEMNSFWAARSEPTLVSVYAEVDVEIKCPDTILENTDFECLYYVTSGTGLQSASIKESGTEKQALTLVPDPMYFHIGGNMKADRYNVYPDSFDRFNKRTAMFINLNHEFATDASVRAFEAYVTWLDDSGEGCMHWMIYKPTCKNPDETYCNSLKKCIDATETWCGDPEDFSTFVAPAGSPVFCSDVERFTTTDNYACPHIDTLITGPEADYEVVYTHKTCTTSKGSNVWKVPEPYMAKTGYVLGWMPDKDKPLDVGYYKTSLTFDEARSVYNYSEIYDASVGRTISHQYAYASLNPVMHMVRAYAFAPTMFAYTHTGLASTGTPLKVEFEAVSDKETKLVDFEIPITQEIDGLVATVTENALAGGTVSLDASVTAGSNFIKWCVHWGITEFNGTCDYESTSASLSGVTKTFDKVGEYTITVDCENPLGFDSIEVSTIIRGNIDKWEFFDPSDPIPVVVTNANQMIDLVGAGSGLVSLDYKCIDINGFESVFTSEVILSNYVVFESSMPYSAPQDVLCSIKLSHPLDTTNNLAAYGSVEDLIVAPPALVLDPKPTNDTVTYTLDSHQGTNVTYKWDFGNGDILWTNDTFNQLTIDYMYTKFGNYTIKVFMWNQVNNATITFPVTIMDKLDGLEFTSESFDSNFQQATNISFSLKVGTAVDFFIDYGINDQSTGQPIKSPLATNLDVVGYAIFGRGSLTYHSRGVYTVTVTAKNAVDELTITKEVSIESPVENLEVTLTQASEGDPKTNFLEQDEELTITTTITKGDNVMYQYILGDEQQDVITSDPSITIKYPVWRVDPPYTITIFATNIVSNVSVTTSIPVQRPIQPLTGFKLLHGPENSTELMEFVLDVEQGDFFDCTFNWGDGSPTELMTYQMYNTSTPKGLIRHQFESGEYVTKVNCSSRLHEIEIETISQSYTPVGFFEIDTYRACEGADKELGVGDFGDMFPIECPVMFFCGKQLGRNVTYSFDYGYKDEEGVPQVSSQWTETDNETYHLFKMPEGLNNYKFQVKIEARSEVGTFAREIKVHMLESIKNFTVGLKEPTVMIGQLANFTATIIGSPYKPCFLIDYGDGNTQGMFGNPECTTKDEYALSNFLLAIESNQPINGKELILGSYKYPDVLLYPVTVTAKNPVSTIVFVTSVKISDLKCDPPLTTFESALAAKIEDASEKAPMRKCREYKILTKVVPDCLKTPVSIIRSWALHRVEMINETHNGVEEIGTKILETIEIPGNDTRYVINPRQLHYGLYMIEFNASMWDHLKERTVPESLSNIKKYFEITRCDLVATIAGGSGRAVGQNGTIEIDASASTDPDLEPGTEMGLQFNWFCKRAGHAGEDLPQDAEGLLADTDDVSMPATPFPATTNKTLPRDQFFGCFGTGAGRLTNAGHTGPILLLDTMFMLFSQSYNIFLVLSQDGREKKELIKYDLKVVFGEPPIVSISCILNCEGKQNPSDKTTLLAKCKNCNGAKPLYSWEMFERKEGEGDDAWKNVTTHLATMAMVDITKSKNLAIKPNAFSEGYEYVVKLSVYWDLFSLDTGGFSQFTIKVNTPPAPTNEWGGCYATVGSGKALETKFQLICTDIDDIDKPLLYSWDYLPVGKPAEDPESWNPCTFPKPGLGLSEEFTLPAGDPERRDNMMIRVIVSDLFGAAMAPILFEVRVEPKKLDGAAVDAMLNDEAAMSDPAVMGSVMNGLLESLTNQAPADGEKKEEKSSVDAAAVKNKMVEMIANVKIDSNAGCTMVANTLNGASDPNATLSDDSMGKSLTAASNVAGFAGELSPAELASIAAKTLSASSKFTGVMTGDNAADNMKAAMDSEALLTSGAAGNMVAGEEPTAIVTANGKTKVSCIDPRDPTAIEGFTMPDMSDGEDEPECQGATNPEGNNRYGFSKTAGSVHGGTKGLSLSAGFGKKKKVANLTKPIRLVLPNNDVIPPPETHNAYCEIMRVVHLVECKENQSNIFMKMKPLHNNYTDKLFIFMNKGIAPSLIDHQHNCTLPNPYPDNFENMTQAEQDHFENEERWRCFITSTAMNDTCTGRWCVGVIQFREGNLTEMMKPRDYPLEKARCQKLNYTFYAYTRACLYWDEPKKRFKGDGCKASPETSDKETICYCDHLTDFGGGGPFAEPNPIDFGAALSGFGNIGDNPTVFSVVLSIFGLYLIMLVWARWKDKKDIAMNALYPLEDNHPNDTYFYELSVSTGYQSNAGTTSELFITLHGTLGESSPRKLTPTDRKCFQKAGQDNFLLAVPYSLGDLKAIEIWHNNTGASPGWFHMETNIRDTTTMKKYIFVSNQWFDVAEEDGLISRKVERAAKSDLVDFNFMFAKTLRKNLYDGHIWFSIFTRPATSTFTRCQRLAACLALLLSTMLANAMFYTGDEAGPPSASVVIGPFTISIEMIRVGVTSALIVVPAHLLVILLFKKAGPKKIKQESEEEGEMGDDALNASQVKWDDKSVADIQGVELPLEDEEAKEEESSAQKRNSFVKFLRSILFSGREDEEDELLRKKKKPLPHWLVYIGFFTCFVISMVCGFFVMLYGFAFGKVKSDKWIVAMMISFAQSVFLLQPVKVVVLSVAFSLMVKDPTRGDDDDSLAPAKQKKKKKDNAEKLDSDEDSELEEEAENITKKKKKLDEFKLPEERKLEEARMARLAEKRVKLILKEIIIHFAFLSLCLMVAYAAADPYSFNLAKATKEAAMENAILKSYKDGKAYNEEVQRVVKNADGVMNRLEWFDWARYSVIDYLFPFGWYNWDTTREFEYKKGFTADTMASKVMAMARFRQLRVKKDSCQKHPVFEHLVEECNAGYSWSVEQQENYSPGWQPDLNKTMRYRARRGKRKALYLGLEDPWRYKTSSELQAFPFMGKFKTYAGGSYAVSIGPTKRIAKKIIESMKENFWVDRYTRAIITEANIYNANTNLLLIATFLHEILPTGGWSHYYNIQSLRLYRYVGGLGQMILLFDIIFVIVTFIGWYKVAKHSRKMGGFKKYLANAWNLLHFIVTFCSTGAIVCTIGRKLFVRWAVENYVAEPEMYTSFATVAQLEYFIMGFIGFVVFFTNLEFLRILRFNRRVGLLTKTVAIIGAPMASFGVLFIVVFMAYVSFAHCVYSDKLEGYSTIMFTFVSLTEMFMGAFDINELVDQAPFFGPIMFFTYIVLIVMILMNMFIGIICDAFAAVREESDEEEETDVMKFMSQRMKKFTGIAGGPMAPIYSDWKSDWEITMEKLEDRCENCLYAMKNVENEEIRTDKWFRIADPKKRSMLAGLVGSEYLLYENELIDALQVIDRRLKRMSPDDAEEFLQAAARMRAHEKAEEEEEDDDESDDEESEYETEESGEDSGEETE